ncbi:hypothetical protein T459_33464 [Capsicum annuum]|uniref:Uncharacterized protein n=1 Tax=Capsicum annuum TaxID=4072 RepID=A0A2G2XYV8_CAPAN|nr:hypothetical protein T459_33464 [Capsicum annuum]
MQITNAINLNPKITLHFISDLYKNTSLLEVHCKSKDDIGVRKLRSGDQFDFSFHMNFFGTTLSKHNNFDVFKWRKSYYGGKIFMNVLVFI